MIYCLFVNIDVWKCIIGYLCYLIIQEQISVWGLWAKFRSQELLGSISTRLITNLAETKVKLWLLKNYVAWKRKMLVLLAKNKISLFCEAWLYLSCHTNLYCELQIMSSITCNLVNQDHADSFLATVLGF